MNYKFNNYFEMLEFSAKNFSSKKAIFEDKNFLTYKEFKRQIDQISYFLKQNDISFGQNVAIFVKNSKEFITSFFGSTSNSCAVVINTFLKDEEVKYILNDCEAKIIFASLELKDELTSILHQTKIRKIIWIGEIENLQDIELECKNKQELEKKKLALDLELYQNENEDIQIKHFAYNKIIKQNNIFKPKILPKLDDISHIIYTSGTTGKPKGAMLTYKNIFSNTELCARRMSLKPKDKFIVFLPMFHSFTLTVMIIMPIYVNATLVVVKSVFPFSNVLKQVLLKRITVFLGIPSIFTALAKTKLPWYFKFFNKVRIFISGSSSLSKTTIDAFKQKFPKATILEGYGLSECSPVVSVNPPKKEKILSVGPALDEYEIKIVDENLMEVKKGQVGQIIIKGDCVMKGYYNNLKETKETIINSWLKTGDLGKVDEDNYLYIVDRLKDLIIAKGINIYPKEIEEVILQFNEVLACAVIGAKNDKGEEEVLAFIEVKEDEKLDEKELKSFLKSKLANYKIPKYIYFTKELPKNATGKVLKRVLKEQFLNKRKKGNNEILN